MMKRLFFIAMMAVACLTVNAQNDKFGKPTQDEWDLTDVSFAPDAEAVVLYKSVELAYNLQGSFTALGSGGEQSLDDPMGSVGITKYISPEGSSMEYNVKVRVKVLKDSGIGYSSMDIVTYNEEEDMNKRDEIFDMKVMVLSNVNGKIKKKRVPVASFKDERINDYYVTRHVRIPDVKAGDIIEYQYKLFSGRITYIFDTQLQESIPVIYSKCVMEIPYLLQFSVNKPEISNVRATAKQGTMYIKSPSNDMSLPRHIQTNLFTIEAVNLPAYDGEINQQNISSGKVYSVRTELQDKRYDVKVDKAGPVRHLIIGK